MPDRKKHVMYTATDPGYNPGDTFYAEFEPGLRLIHEGEGVFDPGLGSRIKDAAGRFWHWITSAPRKVAGWIKGHAPEGVTSKVQSAWGWTTAVAGKLWSAIGWTGAAGAGLLMASTKAGRKPISFLVGRPLVWLVKKFGSSWTFMSSFYADNLGGFGDWMAKMMAGVEEFLLGTQTIGGEIGKEGVLITFAMWYYKHISPRLALDGLLMRVFRLAGTLMLGLKVVAGLALLPIAGTVLVVAQYAGWAVVIGAAAYQSFRLGQHLVSFDKAQEWLNRNNEDDKTETLVDEAIRVDLTTLIEDVASATGTHTNGAKPSPAAKAAAAKMSNAGQRANPNQNKKGGPNPHAGTGK